MLAGSDHGGRILLSKQTPAPLLPEKNEGEMAMLLSRNVKKIFGPGHREYTFRVVLSPPPPSPESPESLLRGFFYPS